MKMNVIPWRQTAMSMQLALIIKLELTSVHAMKVLMEMGFNAALITVSDSKFLVHIT